MIEVLPAVNRERLRLVLRATAVQLVGLVPAAAVQLAKSLPGPMRVDLRSTALEVADQIAELPPSSLAVVLDRIECEIAHLRDRAAEPPPFTAEERAAFAAIVGELRPR